MLLDWCKSDDVVVRVDHHALLLHRRHLWQGMYHSIQGDQHLLEPNFSVSHHEKHCSLPKHYYAQLVSMLRFAFLPSSVRENFTRISITRHGTRMDHHFTLTFAVDALV